MGKYLWKNDEVVIFGKHIVTKRKAAWYGDSDYLYTYSNTTKQVLGWTKELSDLKQIVEKLAGTIQSFNLVMVIRHIFMPDYGPYFIVQV